jgi:hypothetical protein
MWGNNERIPHTCYFGDVFCLFVCENKIIPKLLRNDGTKLMTNVETNQLHKYHTW